MKKQFVMGLVLAGVLISPPRAQAAAVDLKSAADFTILAGSAITSTGGGTVDGNVGLSPETGAKITGLTAVQVNGVIYTVDDAGPEGKVQDEVRLTAAKDDLTTAYNTAAGLPVDNTVATELGGTTKTPGVYDSAAGTFGIESNGILTLDAEDDPDAVFVFKMKSTLVTAVGSDVQLINGANAANVFWQVGSSATLGATSRFKGNILADQSITMETGSGIEGRALARDGQVTFDSQHITEPTPTLALLTDVRGRFEDGVALVSWDVALEIDTAGYDLERRSGEGWVRVNADPIPAQLFVPGARTYELADPEGRLDATATYRLLERLHDGSAQALGEWTLRFEAPAPLAGQLDARPEEPPYVALEAPTSGPAVKVAVVTNDIYAVSFASIAAGLGLTTEDVAERAAQGLLAMRCGDDPVAYLADTNLERIVFYGRGVAQRYTRTNFYWIEPGAGQHMQRVAPASVAVASDQTFYGVRDHERDLVSMVDHSGALRDDLYFWTHVVSGSAIVEERAFEAPLDGYASGDVAITVRLTGWNDTPANQDHLAEVRFNNQLLGAVGFDGKADVAAMFIAPAAAVLPADNQLRIKGVLQDDVSSSTIVIDGFEIGFTQYYAPSAGLLFANDGGHARLTATLFSDPVVLDVTDPDVPVWIADEAGALPAGQSWAAAAGSSWALRERAAIPTLAPQPGGFGGWLRDHTNAVDYLVIAPRAFEAPARVLADYRASLGLRSAVALYEDICDQFAGGLNTPDAIHAFLSHAHRHWAVAPWMVLLGGWGHYDYLGAQTTAINHLPALLGSDGFTLRPADGLLADVLGDDGVPDLAIGRLPVQSVAQFDAYIAKLQAYEAAGPQAAHQRAVFVADNMDAGGDFTASNLEIALEAAQRYTPEHTTRDDETVGVVRADILEAFTTGAGVVHYTGHGTYRQLAAENLLDYDDVAAWENPPVPLFISLTCLVGRFDIYLASQRSLAEALVLQPNGGVLAAYVPSGLSWNDDGVQFAKAFYGIHAEERGDTIGPALLQTRQTLGVLSGRAADALRTFNLLGDPALKLRGGEGGTPPAWVRNFAHWRWEQFGFADLGDASMSAPQVVGAGESYSNFLLYALGLAPGQGLTPAGLSVVLYDPHEGFVVDWQRRRQAPDVEYRLRVSLDLDTWDTEPADLHTQSLGLAPDGVMEIMRSRIHRLGEDRLFVHLLVLPK